MPSKRKIVIGLFLLILLLPWVLQAQPSRQYKIEAAFLYNFFNYVTWPGYDSPESLTEPTICINGQDPVEPYLRYIQRVRERNLTIRKLQRGESAAGCHLLFVRQSVNAPHIPDSTLVVLESGDDLTREGMIELKQQEERIAMVIRNSEMKAKGFTVSSRLLDLAEVH